MLYNHSQTAAHDFSASPETVYSAILSQKQTPTDKQAFGAFLSLKRLWGTPGEAGYQMLARINWGGADLEMTETILATDPPRSYRISQRPQRYVALDPMERRLPINMTEPTNLQKLFDKTYGSPPATTEMQFDLAPTAGGTTLTLTIETRLVRKLGWLARRKWQKRVAREVTMVFQQIETALHVL